MATVERLTNCTTGGPVFVDVRDGKIVRLTPIELSDDDKGDWTIEARGRTLHPAPQDHPLAARDGAQVDDLLAASGSSRRSSGSTSTPRASATSTTAASPATSRSAGTRPWTSSPTRSSGSSARSARRPSSRPPGSHHLWGNIGYRHSAYFRFMNLVGFTYAEHNPDSWEGWHWGAMHMWGYSHRLGIPEQYDLLEDALKHTEMVVFWSADPETTGGGIYAAFESTPRRFWLKELGVKMVFIDPYYNHTAGLFADKWFSPRLGTDVAFGSGDRLHLADRGHLRQGVRRRPHHRLRRVEGLRPRRERRRAQDARMGRGRVRHPGPRHPGPGPGVGRQEDHARRRRSRRLGRRLPLGHRQRVGPHHGRPGRHAGLRASRAATSGAPRRARRPTTASCSPATPRAASPATSTTRPPASAGPSACSRRAAPRARRTTPPRARRCRASASPKP